MADGNGDVDDLIEPGALGAFLDRELGGGPLPVEVALHTAGFSNVTAMVTRGEERMVLRRPPGGKLLPRAHDVLREYRFISALHGRGVRVPRPIVACEDPEVIGAPFYLMERVEGREIRDAIPAAYDHPAGRRAMTEEFIDGLVELHAVDWTTTGLFGKPEGFLGRQVELWMRQLEVTEERTRVIPGFREIGEWLRANLPESRETVVLHGDYKLDNTLWPPDEPKLLAILDWELATIGDPLADLGWVMATWGDPNEQPPPGEEPVVKRPAVGEGFPDMWGLAELYGERSGRELHDLTFYVALQRFKGAVIVEGIYMRAIEGNVTNPLGLQHGLTVPAQVENLQRLIDTG